MVAKIYTAPFKLNNATSLVLSTCRFQVTEMITVHRRTEGSVMICISLMFAYIQLRVLYLFCTEMLV